LLSEKPWLSGQGFFITLKKINMKINDLGFWETTDETGHIHDRSISAALCNYLADKQAKTVVDFGCGMGDYAKAFKADGYKVEAYDGNPNTETLSGGIAKVLDLSKPFYLGKKFDVVLSLEVGEHIPAEFEELFIDNITKHAKKHLVISWAIEGQGGSGHVNCKNNDYIIGQIEDRGFKFNFNDSEKIRKAATNASWFGYTIMVFDKV
jgi:2-polyprenyl-3-methyl-5-hydroxy-6-metoxy-1,4-benzoquinol methylase